MKRRKPIWYIGECQCLFIAWNCPIACRSSLGDVMWVWLKWYNRYTQTGSTARLFVLVSFACL